MIEYSHDPHKFAEQGLQLNLPPDLIPPNQYAILDNAVSRIEGRIETRDGIALLMQPDPGSPIHSLFRLTQKVPGVPTWRLIGAGNSVFYADIADNVPHMLTGGFDGTPLSIMAYRFDADPQIWAIIANGAKMIRVKPGYTEPLGILAPTVAPSATAGAAGNLTGSYDWLYTYVDPVTLGESNQSPTMNPSPPSVPTFSTFVNPINPGGGDIAFLNPGNAIDGNPATFAEGIASGDFASTCLWNGASGISGGLTLNVLHAGTVGSIIQITYSLDGGMTFNSLYVNFSSGAYAQRTDSIAIPDGTDLSLVQVAATAGQRPSSDLMVYEIYFTQTSPPTVQITLTAQIGVVCVAPPPAINNGTTIRLYRRGGTLNDAYRAVGDFPVATLSAGTCGGGTLEIDDNVPDSTLSASNILTLDSNAMPVSSVQTLNQPLLAIWGYDDRILGCGDPNRPESVYFSNRGQGDDWPPQNWLDVAPHGDEAMNGLVYALRCFVFSRERMYTLYTTSTSLPSVLQGGPAVATGATFAASETSCRRGLKGRWAFCTAEKGIYFVSKDGIYRTQGGPEESVIDDSIRPLFPTHEGPGRDVGAYIAPDMTNENALRLAFHNGEIWFDYTGLSDSLRHRLIYDERRNRWRSESYAKAMQMAYSEPETASSLLSGDIQGNIQQGSGTLEGNVAVHFRTGSFDQGKPLNLKEYGNVIFDLDPGGATVTITPYINGNATPDAALTITGSGRQRVALNLSDTYALNMSFDVQWTATPEALPVLYQFDILYRFEPAAVRHWEVPPNSLRIQGWFHVRDCYVTLRSAAPVTMTFTPDSGTAQVFTLPSTSGAKQKLYLPFAANKERLVQFSFDSTGDFRLYQDECELRAKQWLTKLGYTVIPIFGSESQ